jgi:Nucleoside-diphosphate-sugar epimerases
MKIQRRVVYITGVTGNIGRVLAQGLANAYELRGNSRSGAPVEGVRVSKGNITDGEFMRRELEGVDTVIHLAGDPSPGASWQSVLENNIDGTYQVYEAARLAGVRRIIFASTNHVTGILTERAVEMDEHTPFYPDTLYGVSKAAGEALGRFYAERYGLSVLNFRIGWFLGHRDEKSIVDLFKNRKDAYPLMWLSPRDCIQAHRCGIEAPDELKFGSYYIMSNNRDALWDMTNAREELGYEPQDDLAALFEKYGEPYNFRIPSGPWGG